MRIFQPYWMALSATLISIAIIPQLLAQNGDITENIVHRNAKPPASTPNPKILQTLIQRLTPKILLRSPVQPRSPVETPPTAYLPYPPPSNYVWPPGPHTQYPPPSETNAPAGWYGGTGTGGQGNSGAGSASNANSRSTSAGAPGLRIPSLASLPLHLLMFLLPSSLLPRKHRHPHLKPRHPVETPPTQFLPYPPPPSYQWPQGQNPGNENPQPSEFDPPRGVYGSGSGSGNANADSGASNTSPRPSTGGGGGGWGRGHVAWVVIVTIFATAFVVGGLAWWYREKMLAGGGAAGGGGEKKDAGPGKGIIEALGKMKFWGKGKGQGKKEGGGGQPAPPPAAAGGGGGGDDDDDD
ncbi:MAG: hypothetical protein Q9209_006280 [Squamulea sp. 1 TL-2023]